MSSTGAKDLHAGEQKPQNPSSTSSYTESRSSLESQQTLFNKEDLHAAPAKQSAIKTIARKVSKALKDHHEQVEASFDALYGLDRSHLRSRK